ncbi:MAG TPA: imidazole glycerol phosphate synthase subunit HisH [Terriglobia bacterium]|nr:imidazole glycerol phosphate synthase subunit HisH [Terriglobia bacterium]
MIGVIDYGAGNVGSVLKAVRYLGNEAAPVEDVRQLSDTHKIILPGQGHFASMMKSLGERRLIEPLKQWLAQNKPFLGICLGLQALYESSDEAPDTPGFGLLPGRVRKLEGIFKVPHLGWNQLDMQRESSLLREIEPASFVYYCHSYYAPVTSESVAVTEYGSRFSAAVEMGRVQAVQFHPEKSGEAGLRVFKNFLDS